MHFIKETILKKKNVKDKHVCVYFYLVDNFIYNILSMLRIRIYP